MSAKGAHDLLQQVERAHRSYVEAHHTYRSLQQAAVPERVQKAARDWEAAGQRLDRLLTALIQYLEPMRYDVRFSPDYQRARQMQLTLRRELQSLH